jgi:pyridoxamine 5'-phosphate oxidase
MSHFADKDSLDAILNDIWQRLVRGKADRRSPFHTPFVASVNANGAPQQRVMVLRHVDREAATLRFHTDLRSGKVGQLNANDQVSVIGYDAGAKVQIRLSGKGILSPSGDVADSAWTASASSSRRGYLAEIAPGTESDVATSGLPPAFEGSVPTLPQTESGRQNFAVLLVTVKRLEWLYLASDGHRRAVFTPTSGQWIGQWLVP